jgi:hypothetical protein
MPKKQKFKIGDTVKLNEAYVKKVMEHEKVFLLYHEHGVKRDWIVSLCKQETMRIEEIEQDANRDYVLKLRTDPCNAVWQQEWFEFVAHENFIDEDDLFSI